MSSDIKSNVVRAIKIILGFLQSIGSVFWIYFNINLFYRYHFTDILFAFRLPDWVLALEIILCLINLNFGIKLILNVETVLRSFLILLLTLLIGILINNFYYLLH